MAAWRPPPARVLVGVLLLACVVAAQPQSRRGVQESCSKNDARCWQRLRQEQEAAAEKEAEARVKKWGEEAEAAERQHLEDERELQEGQCRNGVGPGCSQEKVPQQQPPPPRNAHQPARTATTAPTTTTTTTTPPPPPPPPPRAPDPMQEAAERAAQHAKELHDKEFERVRAESARHQESGGGDTEVQEELKRRAKLAGQGASKPYEVLGVQVSATRSEIKKAYRRLSLLLHPDKVKDPKQKQVAQSVFMDIVAAYEVLGSEDKRQAFDDLGDADGTKKETFNTYWEYQKFGNKKTKANNDFFTGHPFIVNLNSATWNRRVTGSSVWLVDFYAPWCSHCVDMVPEYKKEQILKRLYIHTMYTYIRSTDLKNLLECFHFSH